MKNIPDSLKIYELSRIWKEAAYNFAFWDKVDIDWDAEYRKALERVRTTENTYDYYRELKRFLALLNDGHTDVALPGEIYNDPEYCAMIPVILGKIGQFIVLQTSEELRDRIPLFSTLVKIDGTDVDEYVRENCLPYFWHAHGDACGITAASEIMTGRRGSSAVYTFEKDGKPFDIRLEREDPSKITWHKPEYAARAEDGLRQVSGSDTYQVRITDDGIAVIRMVSFMDDSMPEKIYACFDELKNAKGYIIDVRGNTGGNSGNADKIAALFIGNNTAGTSGQPLCEPLESGGFFRICTRRCIAQNGEDIYNKGFSPDIRVLPTVEGFQAGQDPVFDKALEIIRGKISG